MDKRNGPISRYIPAWIQDAATVASWALTIAAILYYLTD